MSIGDVVDADDNRIVTDVDVGAHVDVEIVDVDVTIAVGVDVDFDVETSCCNITKAYISYCKLFTPESMLWLSPNQEC